MTRNNHLIGFVATIVFLFFAGWFNYRNYLLKQPIQEEPATLPQPEVCNTISPYDHLFKQYADSIKWDWQLLAAMAYKESKFDTSVVSWAGAKGLMQLMPRTARAMGVPEGMEQNAEESIKGAVRYLAELERSFRRIPDPDERKNFILASYNAGIGHILDAMALADKYGHDKYRWKDNVEKYILLKNDSVYYTDSLCRNGRFKGKETYVFVRDIRKQYKKYLQETEKDALSPYHPHLTH